MPKMKSKSGAKKRFSVTRRGKVRVKQSFARHMMMNKPKSAKRKMRGKTVLAEGDARKVLRSFLPYSRKIKNKHAKKTVDGTNPAYKDSQEGGK